MLCELVRVVELAPHIAEHRVRGGMHELGWSFRLCKLLHRFVVTIAHESVQPTNEFTLVVDGDVIEH